MTKVSVIMPVYNVEKYLDESVRSVLEQSLTDIELICVDDCSPDRCPEMLDEYARRDSRVKVIHNRENRRQGFARNRGIEKACGKYLYFLDSDDMIEGTALEELYELAERDSLDAVFFDARNHFESEEMREVYTPEISMRKGEYEDRVYTGKELFETFMKNREWTCYPQRIFWKRDFIDENGIRYLEDIEHEDEFFAFAGILLAERTRYVRRDWFILRIRPNSVMTTPPTDRNYHGYLMNMYYMCDFVMKHGIHSFAADANISRMHERVNYFRELLGKDEDLSGWFRSDFDRGIYRFFNDRIIHRKLPEEIREVIENAGEIYIYGAGQVARSAFSNIIDDTEVHVRAFLVTENDGGARAYRGVGIEEFDPEKVGDTLIVLSVGNQLYPLLSKKLDDLGMNWIYCRRR